MTKSPRFTDDDIRAAFQLRAAGIPRHDLHDRIGRATRAAHDHSALVLLPRRGQRQPMLARVAAIGTVAAILIVAPLVGVGSFGLHGPGPLLGQPAPDDRASAVVAAAIEDDDDDEDFEGSGEDDKHDDEDDAHEGAREGNLRR